MSKKNPIESPSTVPDELYDTRETAAMIKVKPATLEQKRWLGDGIPYVKVGRLVRYRRKDIDAYLDKHVYNSTTEEQAAKGVRS